MKYVWRLAFLGVLLSPLAKAEVTAVKKNQKSATAQLKAFENFDERIQALENYAVKYWDGTDNRRYIVMKEGTQSKKQDGLTVELRSAKKKS